MDVQFLSEQLKNLDSKIIAAIIAAIVSIIIAVLNHFIQRKSLSIQKKSIGIQARQAEKAEKEILKKKIRKELDEFYIPFDLYLSKSTEYYKYFRSGFPKEFRTLVYFVDNDTKFKKSDGTYEKVIVNKDRLKVFDEIMKILDNLQRLIIEKSFVINDPVLVKSYDQISGIANISFADDEERPSSIPDEIGMLPFFSMHIDFLKMASKNQINKSQLIFIQQYVYPRELNKKIKTNIKELRSRLEQLNI